MENKKIKVAEIIGKWVGGGLEQVVFNYTSRLDKNKFQIDYIIDEDSLFIPTEEIEKAGINIIIVPPYQKIFDYQKSLIKIFKENQYDIVHSHENALSIFPLRAAKKAGIKVRIAHSHSTTNQKEKKKNALKQILRPFSKIYATDYMACSELAGRWLFGDKTFDQGKVYILNNAIDLSKFKYNEEVRKNKRKELEIDDDTFVIGHIGRFVQQKNHTFLIDVFNEVQKKKANAKLILVGQGPLKDEIENKVKNLNLENKVVFLGQREDVDELYQAFDCFVLPSLYEGLGMVLIEAQASGLPCIASTEIPDIARVTEKLKFVRLDENIDYWKNSILKLSDLKNRKEDQLQDIQNRVYNIEKEVEKLEILYKDLGENNDK